MHLKIINNLVQKTLKIQKYFRFNMSQDGIAKVIIANLCNQIITQNKIRVLLYAINITLLL